MACVSRNLSFLEKLVMPHGNYNFAFFSEDHSYFIVKITDMVSSDHDQMISISPVNYSDSDPLTKGKLSNT